jgi:pantoate ligase/cytidylate kinase
MKPAVDTVVFETVSAYEKWRTKLRHERPQAKIGFVPTMGALHEGHASLVRKARQECDFVVVSIFVNPLQFGPNEDFDRYPRTFPDDLEICRSAGVDAVFHPSVGEIYPCPLEQMTKVIPPAQLIDRLCGSFRPGHFEGVATIVLKLFNIVQPTQAYFGEKDYQQLTVIRRMARDLDLPLAVIGVPTIREDDGLAMSSRNVYLTKEHRALAPKLHKAITFVRDAGAAGSTLDRALEEAKQMLAEIPDLQLQYLEACDGDTLEPLKQAKKPMVVLVAAKLGNVRLIDNVLYQ